VDIKSCFAKGYLVKIKPSANKMHQSLRSAKGAVKKARDNVRIKNMDVAMVMAYTAIFHAFRSLLFMKGVKERSHICMFEYIRENFPELKELAKEADAYRRFRHTALYGLEVLVSRDEASAAIELAGEITKERRKTPGFIHGDIRRKVGSANN